MAAAEDKSEDATATAAGAGGAPGAPHRERLDSADLDGPGAELPGVEPPESTITEDRFYHGVIAQVSWTKGTGVVRSGNGREIPFDFPLVTVVGEHRQIEHLQAGMRVGFDVGWTSHGLRVTMLKLYP